MKEEYQALDGRKYPQNGSNFLDWQILMTHSEHCKNHGKFKRYSLAQLLNLSRRTRQSEVELGQSYQTFASGASHQEGWPGGAMAAMGILEDV